MYGPTIEFRAIPESSTITILCGGTATRNNPSCVYHWLVFSAERNFLTVVDDGCNMNFEARIKLNTQFEIFEISMMLELRIIGCAHSLNLKLWINVEGLYYMVLWLVWNLKNSKVQELRGEYWKWMKDKSSGNFVSNFRIIRRMRTRNFNTISFRVVELSTYEIQFRIEF